MGANVVGHPQFFAEPERQRGQVRLEARGCAGNVGLDKTRELDQRLFVKSHQIDAVETNPGLAKAVLDSTGWKASVVLLPREAFLMGRTHDPAILDQACGRVVVV